MGTSYHFNHVHVSELVSLSVFSRSYLLLLLLNGLEVGFEVHRLLDLGPQQSSQHGVGRHPHPLQVRSLHFALQLKDLLREVLNLLFPGQQSISTASGTQQACLPAHLCVIFRHFKVDVVPLFVHHVDFLVQLFAEILWVKTGCVEGFEGNPKWTCSDGGNVEICC